ncbi:hypothetical protein [Anaerosporobacter faecicola]|uniref:hypothetical protein n=1 Tax=Anaerosporobacter faecicola TaxID=2718714 RepID=UPI0014387581|nr:hypothetical protein [Anaerosporobacter faecicola]
MLLSDQWIAQGYESGERIKLLGNLINFEYWYDKDHCKIGVIIHFEYAEDAHYEFIYDEFCKFIKRIGDMECVEKSLRDYFSKEIKLYEFSDFLEKNKIMFDRIVFYST